MSREHVSVRLEPGGCTAVTKVVSRTPRSMNSLRAVAIAPE
jgi:hypothetical protein